MTYSDLLEQGLDIKNVKITGSKLCFDDLSLTYYLNIVGDGFSARIGGAPLGKLLAGEDVVTTYDDENCAKLISGILSICNVTSWEDVVGTYIRVAIDKSTKSIAYIGHIIADSEWLCVRTEV